MDKDTVLKHLCEYYGIPPHHQSTRRGDAEIVKNLEGALKLPLDKIEEQSKFNQVKHFWDNQTRRVGKDVTALLKQLTR